MGVVSDGNAEEVAENERGGGGGCVRTNGARAMGP